MYKRVITIFFLVYRKGDYYRYLAEFKSGNERKEVADLSQKAYEVIICFLTCICFLLLHFSPL